MTYKLESKVISNTTLSAVIANMAHWINTHDVDDKVEDVVFFKDQNYGMWCATIYYYWNLET